MSNLLYSCRVEINSARKRIAMLIDAASLILVSMEGFIRRFFFHSTYEHKYLIFSDQTIKLVWLPLTSPEHTTFHLISRDSLLDHICVFLILTDARNKYVNFSFRGMCYPYMFQKLKWKVIIAYEVRMMF